MMSGARCQIASSEPLAAVPLTTCDGFGDKDSTVHGAALCGSQPTEGGGGGGHSC